MPPAIHEEQIEEVVTAFCRRFVFAPACRGIMSKREALTGEEKDLAWLEEKNDIDKEKGEEEDLVWLEEKRNIDKEER